MKYVFTTVLYLLVGCGCTNQRVSKEDYDQSLEHYRAGEYEEALISAQVIVANSNDPKILGDTEYLRGYIYHLQDSIELAYTAILNAKMHYTQIDDIKGLSTSNNMLGQMFYEYDSYEIAKKYFSMSLKYAQESNNEKLIANSFYGLGRSEKRFDNLEMALEYMSEALKFESRLERLPYFINVKFEMADIFHLTKSYQIACEKNWEAINSSMGSEIEKLTKARAYYNIGDLYLDQRKYTQAQRYLDTSLNLSVLEGADLAVLYNNFGRLYHGMGNEFLAAQYFKKSLDHNHHKTDMIEVAETKANFERMMDNGSLSKDSLLLCFQAMLDVSIPDHIIGGRLEYFDTKMKLELLEQQRVIDQMNGDKLSIRFWAILGLITICFSAAAIKFNARIMPDPKSRYRQYKKFARAREKENAKKFENERKKIILDHKKTIEKDLEATKKQIRDFEKDQSKFTRKK